MSVDERKRTGPFEGAGKTLAVLVDEQRLGLMMAGER